MISFLSKFLGSLSSIQAKQVLRILSQQRDQGEIRDLSDFQKKLSELAKLVQSDEAQQQTPLFFLREGDIIESDAFRHLFDYARLDLESLLGSIETLGNSNRAHRRILEDHYFHGIESAIEELNAEITAYEILEYQKYEGFSSVIKQMNFDTLGGVAGEDPTSLSFQSLRTDTRSGREPPYSAPTDGRRGFHLGIKRDSSIMRRFSDVSLRSDSLTPHTEFETSTSRNSPLNAIDGDPDSGWTHSILLSEFADKCRLKVVFSFDSPRRVNSIVLAGLSEVPMIIYSISYIDSGNQEHSLPVGLSQSPSREGYFGEHMTYHEFWRSVNGKFSIPLGDITARSIVVTLQQDTAVPAEFFYSEEFGDWERNPSFDTMQDVLGTPGGRSKDSTIAEELGFYDDEDLSRARFVEYSFGLRDVYALEMEYHPDSIFIPETIQDVQAPKTLAFYTDAEMPTEYETSIELFLRKENFSSDNLLLDVETIPILPYGSSSVSERLFLRRQEDHAVFHDTGNLRFFPDILESLVVYREDTALTLGSDYSISVDNGSTWETTLNYTAAASDPKKFWIKIYRPRTDVIYRTTYTPLVSTNEDGGEVWMNATKTCRLGRYQIYVFDNSRPVDKVDHCNLTLQVIGRANTLNTRVSPYLRRLVVLGG